jgi:hypothetical protein
MFWIKSRVITKTPKAGQAETRQIDQALKKLGNIDVLVGVPEGAGAGQAGITQSGLMYIHTHGIRRRSMREEMSRTMKKGGKYSAAYSMYVQARGSPLWHSVPRPVIEPAIEEHKGEIAGLIKKALNLALNGNGAGSEHALKTLGLAAEGWVKERFDNYPENNLAPNRPATVKGKGADHPLVDTGALRGSITHVIRPKK